MRAHLKEAKYWWPKDKGQCNRQQCFRPVAKPLKLINHKSFLSLMLMVSLSVLVIDHNI